MKPIALILISILVFSCSKEKRSDKKGLKMQEFIIEISSYAKGLDSDFIIIPQNGEELAFNDLYPDDGTNQSYLDAIDGFGVEEIQYSGSLQLETERITNLNTLKAHKPIFVSDFVSNNADTTDAQNRSIANGFIPFVRTATNYDYKEIPTHILNENSNNITQLSQAQNYLYFIGGQTDYTTKQTFLTALSATNYDVLLIDLYYGENAFTLAEINQLKTKQNGGQRLVISYINVGAAEKYRYYWQDKWKLHRPLWLKKEYEGYEDEIWVKFWKKDWEEIIYGNDESYFSRIINAGFDGAYLDNVEAYYFLYFD